MARYTMTLSEYLKQGGVLPPCFEELPDLPPIAQYNNENPPQIVYESYPFSKMFVDRFNLREIGFETPALFYQRLNGVAMLKTPQYIKKINLKESIYDVVNVERVESVEHKEGGKTETENGAKTENFTGTFDATSGDPTYANKTSENRGSLAETITHGKTFEDVHTLKGATEGERLNTLERLLARSALVPMLFSSQPRPKVQAISSIITLTPKPPSNTTPLSSL